ncbi:MAG: 50S ribosomal protein L5 [Caldisericia bacterium]|jgi:large subunit ribosomal protein L5|nr:50S ribosomal protein L5 [Caldisericia bacterium]
MGYLKAKWMEIAPKLMERFNYKNIMEVPKIVKIVVNRGIGDATQDPKAVEKTEEEFKLITGQKPIFIKAKKSIASFKVRKGMIIGAKVTLRGKRMEEFFEKLINVALPRIRDFKGLSRKSFDGRGNYTFGVEEQLIFPEIDYDKVDKIRGFDITIVTTAETDEEAEALLELLGFPFERKKKEA